MKTIIRFFVLFLLIFNACQGQESENNLNKKYDLVVCAVFQNEAFFLKEWLEYHKLIGVQHFYLYNNLSTDNFDQILEPYILAGEVELFNWPVETFNQNDYLNLLQIPVYNHALNIVKKTASWAAFIDLDEFIVPVKEDNLLTILNEYSEFAGIGINWQVFGTSFLDTIPKDKLITESLIFKSPEEWEINKTVKLIIQPKLVEAIENPHFFRYKEGTCAVDSQKKYLKPYVATNQVYTDIIKINHYWFGPLNWFKENKLARRAKWGVVIPDDLLFDLISSFNQVQDEDIIKFTPILKEKIFSNRFNLESQT